MKVCFITLSRSDFSTLEPVARAALEDREIDVRLIAGGSHLLSRFGKTIESVRELFRDVILEVDFLREDDDDHREIAAAFARAVHVITEALISCKPDWVFLVGDRWEMLAAASAASMLKIPIAHHSGGDITQGSADNQTRYAISALSHLHLVALELHKQRLAAVGEEEWRIVVTGEPALTRLATIASQKEDVRKRLSLPHNLPYVLATFHPTSYDREPDDVQIDFFLAALDSINDPILLTAPNPDPASRRYLERLRAYAQRRQNVRLVESLGNAWYYAAMRDALFMIGNSSSGLWEAPSFALPVVNIGRRQNGRVHTGNVINAPLEHSEIAKAILKARSPEFKQQLQRCKNPYFMDNSLNLILSSLKNFRRHSKLLAKEFIDPLKRASASKKVDQTV